MPPIMILPGRLLRAGAYGSHGLQLKSCGVLALLLACCCFCSAQQKPAFVQESDERFKADILIVVAHPDDESYAAPYLARVIDQGKRVAVVLCTRGDGGANEAGSEHAAALGLVREVEARHGLADAGIHNVWFASGRDTASQNVLQSLAHWNHGNVLEEVVRFIRLTRPEVIITWLPGVFVGENHGDHQASGVIATEAFDLAGDPTAFPAQVAEPAKRLEPFLEGLHAWQPKKIYYFSDADDDAFFAGKGPAYSTTEISPSRHLPYWRLGLAQVRYYRSQFKSFADIVDRGNQEEIEKLAAHAQEWWSNPLPFIFGKSLVASSITGDIFEGVISTAIPYTRAAGYVNKPHETQISLELAGPWGFYRDFRRAHGLTALPEAAVPEIGIEAGKPLQIPLRIFNGGAASREVTLSISLPEGWAEQNGSGRYTVASGATVPVQVNVTTAANATAPAKAASEFREIICKIVAPGQVAGFVKLRVKLVPHGLPQ